MREPPPPPSSEDSIHLGPLSGKIDGQPFEVKSARYYVDRRPGYERVDIKLSASAAKTPCGELVSPNMPSVWLRNVGKTTLAREKNTVTVGGGGNWAVHYQIRDGRFWIGNGDANALFVLDQIESDKRIHGVLSACFRDQTGSCVAGEFAAAFCRISIDEPVRGTEAMERPPVKALAPPPASAAGVPSKVAP